MQDAPSSTFTNTHSVTGSGTTSTFSFTKIPSPMQDTPSADAVADRGVPSPHSEGAAAQLETGAGLEADVVVAAVVVTVQAAEAAG